MKTPAADPYGFHRDRAAVDRGALLLALIAALVAGIAIAEGAGSLAVGVVAGSTLFAMLAALMSAGSR